LNVNTEEITDDRKVKIISEMHSCPIGGHQGTNRIERIKLYITWPGMEQKVTQFVRNCKTCQINKETIRNIKLPLTITDTKVHPWEKLYLDVEGPLSTTEKGLKYILKCQDNLSKYTIAVPMENQTEKITIFCEKHCANLWNP
jgi:hypothetical protein